MNSNIDEAISAIKGGDKEQGQRLLLKLLESDPQNPRAWIWLSATVEGDRREYCLNKVLEIDPQHAFALQELEKLKQKRRVQHFPQPQQTPTSVKSSMTKRCPYCAETIKAQAIVCRYCGTELKSVVGSTEAREPSKKSNSGCLLVLLILAVLFCGSIWNAGGSDSPSTTTGGTEANRSSVSDEDDYRNFVLGVSSDYLAGVDALGVVNERLSYDPTLIFDNEWRSDFVVASAMIRVSSTRVIERDNVPARYRVFHNKFADAARLYDRSMELYAEAIDDVDPDKLEQATATLRQANSLIESLPTRDLE